MGRDGVIGLATRYGLDGPGIESWGSEVFRTRPDRPWGPFSLQYNGYRDSFPGVKLPGRGVDNPHPSSAEVKERVGHLCSSSGRSWPHLRWTLPSPLPYKPTGSANIQTFIRAQDLVRDHVRNEFLATTEVCLFLSDRTKIKFGLQWNTTKGTNKPLILHGIPYALSALVKSSNAAFTTAHDSQNTS